MNKSGSAWCRNAELSDPADSDSIKEARVCITSGSTFTRRRSATAAFSTTEPKIEGKKQAADLPAAFIEPELLFSTSKPVGIRRGTPS